MLVAPDHNRVFSLNRLGFLVVTLAAYASAVTTMGYVLQRISVGRAAALIGLAAAYLVNGVYGYSRARNADSIKHSILYVATQIIIGSALLFLAMSTVMMFAMLPLVGQAVVLLPRRLMFAACGVMWLGLVVMMTIVNSARVASVLGLFFLAGIVFVLVITDLAVKEQRARREVERLVSELKEANEKLREYVDQVEELATLKERNRLAREIHDSLGHYLTVVIVQIEAAMSVIEKDRDHALAVLRKAQSLAQKGLAEVRQSVAALRTAPTDTPSLVQSLITLVEECRASGLEAEFQLVDTPRRLSPSAELALYRAAQEALTNARKHSHAAAATVTLKYSDNAVCLTVHDDGRGAAQLTRGYGLTGIQERLESLGGEMKITTTPDSGFTLEVELSE